MNKSSSILCIIISMSLVSCASVSARHRGISKNKPIVNEKNKDESADDSTKEDLSDEPVRQIVIWAAGGWNSCVATPKVPEPGPLGMNMFKNFGPMILNLREKYPDVKIDYVASCFTPNIRTLRYIDSSNPEKTKVAPRDSFYEIIQEYSLKPKQPLIVLGHSYGGWLTMKAISQLKDLDIPLYVSIDAISPKTCHIETVWQWIKDKLDGKSLKETDIGCRRSPPDILSDERDQIKSNVSEWYNIWQMDLFDALHADPIEQAKNIEFKQNPALSANGHINMGLNKALWEILEDLVSKAIDQNN